MDGVLSASVLGPIAGATLSPDGYPAAAGGPFAGFAVVIPLTYP